MYPGSDNSDYTLDMNKTNRKENINVDKYEIRKRVNGTFDVKVLTECMPQDLNWISVWCFINVMTTLLEVICFDNDTVSISLIIDC